VLQPKTLAYYDWDDVQQFICDELNITNEQFRDYHEVIGGSYKDWWHVWMSIVYDDVSNDSYRTVWFDILIDVLNEKSTLNEYGDWVLALQPILEKLEQQVGDKKMIVYYSW